GSCVGLWLKPKAKPRWPAFTILLAQPQFQSQARIQKCSSAALNGVNADIKADIKIVPAVLRIDHSAEPEDCKIFAFSSAKPDEITGDLLSLGANCPSRDTRSRASGEHIRSNPCG